MRENVRNVRSHRAGRERWEFALDNRQIAAVAVGALVIVGSAFVLGMNAGSMSARKAAAAAPSNSLDAFNVAHENLPTPPEPKNWEYEKLGGVRPGEPAPSATAQARVPPSPRPLPARSDATAAVAASEPAGPTPSPTASAAPAAAPAVAAPAPETKPSAPEQAKVAAAQQAAPASASAKPPAATPSPAPSAMEKAMAAVSGSRPAQGAAPARAAPAPAAKSGAFVIQIGASTNRAEADRIASRFASRGARVMTADVEGKRWYRVRLASTTYRDRPEAERALNRLSRETGVHGFVTAAQ